MGVGSGPDAIEARTVIPTSSPEKVIQSITAWFADQPTIAALGIASFGPLDVDSQSPNWGHITRTTKAGGAMQTLPRL
jgi:fructokinase